MSRLEGFVVYNLISIKMKKGKEINGQPTMFKDIFVENVVKNFYASSYNVNFSDKEIGKAMGEWISENTNGTLSPKIDTDSQQILSILNTVYFYNQWIDRFDKDKTQEDIFHLLNGEEVKTDFMNQTMGSTGFSKGKNFTRSALGLKNGGQMVFILPDEDVSPYDLFSSYEQIKKIFEEGVEASAFTQIDYVGSADMILNRPFIYGIIASNGSLLFIGIFMNPVE